MDSWLQNIRKSSIIAQGADSICAVEQYVLLGRGASLFLFAAEGSHEEKYDVVKLPSLPESCKITSLVPNRTNQLLAVSYSTPEKTHRVLVISLSFLTSNSGVELGNKGTICASGHLLMQGAEAIQITWHPLSYKSTSLAILDSESVFRLYEASASSSKLEIEWDLTRPNLKYDIKSVQDRMACPGVFLNDETIVSFSFLVSKPICATGWDAFTMITLSRSGLVRRICPILPAECLVNKPALQSELFLALKDLATYAEDRNEAASYPNSLNVQFLSNLLDSPPGPLPDLLVAQPPKKIAATPFLSSPLRSAPYPFDATVLPPPAISLAVLATSRAPIVLIGHCEVLLICAMTSMSRPLWAFSKQAKPGLTTLELVPLKGVHRMIQDSLRPHIFYCFHAGGVAALDLHHHVDALHAQQPPASLPPPAPSHSIGLAKNAVDFAAICSIPTIKTAFIFRTAEGSLIPTPGQWFGKREISTTDKPDTFTWFKDYAPKFNPPESPQPASIMHSLEQLNQEVLALNAT
ncbi:hypothetical protein DSO57_1038415 [Entomophthora muscae]|nr:hypothetical protein DSO57_1038415 [Entomophthora muscae]